MNENKYFSKIKFKFSRNSKDVAAAVATNLFAAPSSAPVPASTFQEYSGKNLEHTNIIIVMLLLQLSNTLKIVADKLGMIHGDLKAGNVFFSIKDKYMDVDYPLNDKINCRTNIRLKIADYGKSSIIYEGVRFYCGSYKTRFVPKSFKANDYNVDETKYYSYHYSDGITDFKPSVKVAHQLRHIKCPYYRSFDLYCVIISLAIQSKLFRDFYLDSKFNLKSTLFSVVNDDPISSIEFEKYNKPNSISTVFELLNHKTLNCNAIEDFIDAQAFLLLTFILEKKS